MNAPLKEDSVFGLYLVMTDPVVGYAKCAEAAVEAGIRYIQLRMKHKPRCEILDAAREVRAVTAGSRTLFIVNDDPSIAAESGADGVHLGQSDMSIGEARRLYPELRLIGLSTHSMEQARVAVAEAPDYIGVGPVFATPTKEIPDPVLGPENAGRIIRAVNVPAVAIGGINSQNLNDVLSAGAINFSVVRAVCGSTTPLDAIKQLMSVWEKHLLKRSLC